MKITVSTFKPREAHTFRAYLNGEYVKDVRGVDEKDALVEAKKINTGRACKWTVEKV